MEPYWEYFSILSERHSLNGMAYKIRGRHSTLYPVQLLVPSWSSPDVVEELIKRFNNYLREQLETMLEDWKWEAEQVQKIQNSIL